MPNITLKLRLFVATLFALVVYVSIIWPNSVTPLVLGIFAVAVLVDRLLRQQVEFEKPRKSRKQPKVDDGIPDDPKIDWALETARRMSQGPTTQKQPQGPVQYNLWGQAEPIKSEQFVRKNDSQEPDWPSFDQMHPEYFK